MVTLSRSPETPIPADRVPRVRGALLRYRVMAWFTGVFLAVMTLAIVYSLVAGLNWVGAGQGPRWYGLGWMIHGWAFVVYVATVLDLSGVCRWKVGRTLVVMLAGTVPFMSFVAERVVRRDTLGRLPA